MRTSVYEDVEEALLMWFKDIHGRNVPVSGELLQMKASELPSELGHDNFSCSNGWLSRFKTRHGISQKRICGESCLVSEETSEKWLSVTLPTLQEGYEARDIFNVDGFVFQAPARKKTGFQKRILLWREA